MVSEGICEVILGLFNDNLNLITYAASSGGTMLTDVFECTWKTSDIPHHSLEGIEKNN